MDPKVYGKLLMLHQRGNGVDVEALHDRIPLRQVAGKGPRWDITGTEGCGGGKVVSWLHWILGYKSIYMRKKYVGGATRGPRGWGRAYPPWACLPTSWPPRGFLYVHSKSPRSRLFQK